MRIGRVCPDLVRIDPVRIGRVCPDPVRIDLVRIDPARDGPAGLGGSTQRATLHAHAERQRAHGPQKRQPPQ